MEHKTPVTLVFYLDRELMSNEEIFAPYTEYIRNVIGEGMIALFIPTDREERVECINPILYEKPDMDKLNKMLEDIEKNFQLGETTDV